MSAWTVYWLFKLDDVQCVALIASIILGIALIVVSCGYVMEWEDRDDRKRNIKIVRPVFYSFLTFLTICTFIPNTKTMAAIIVLPKIASAQNLDMVSKDAGDIYKLAMVRLKDALGETEKSK